MTYSIVGRCDKTGQLGVAVQSYWFAGGARAPHAIAGVGAITTQAIVDESAAPVALNHLRDGMRPSDVLLLLAQRDAKWVDRQVGIVDVTGDSACHTGEGCVEFADAVCAPGVSCQANLMVNPGVPQAMLKAWSDMQGEPLEDRLFAALLAAQAVGGDIRGMQSAAMLIVSGDVSQQEAIVDIRVDDSEKPLDVLAHLLRVQKAYILLNTGLELFAENRLGEAVEIFGEARSMAPDNLNLVFWHGVSLARTNKLGAAEEVLQPLFDQHPPSREFLVRSSEKGWTGLDQKTIDALLSQAL